MAQGTSGSAAGASLRKPDSLKTISWYSVYHNTRGNTSICVITGTCSVRRKCRVPVNFRPHWIMVLGPITRGEARSANGGKKITRPGSEHMMRLHIETGRKLTRSILSLQLGITERRQSLGDEPGLLRGEVRALGQSFQQQLPARLLPLFPCGSTRDEHHHIRVQRNEDQG